MVINYVLYLIVPDIAKICYSFGISVQKPREQVADAEALLDIANTLVSSVKSQANGGFTPSDFVSCLLKHFGGVVGGRTTAENAQNSIRWKDVGLSVSHIFRKVQGCTTMWVKLSSNEPSILLIIQNNDFIT